MKGWYSKVRATELIDENVIAIYEVVFETDDVELKREVEKYLQGIMDRAEQIEPRRKTTEYCDICNHKGCENCISNGLDDYCIPSNFEQTE